MNIAKRNRLKCFVPSCNKTTTKNPQKIFVNVNSAIKKRWCDLLHIDYKKSKRMVCCSDHFNLKEDLQNFEEWKHKKLCIRPKLKSTVILQNYKTTTSTFNNENISQITEEFCKAKDECKVVRELNIKLESELKESRESEKSHRYHVQNSREMIGNLQETVSQLVFLKRDVKKLKEEVDAKDAFVGVLQQEKDNVLTKNEELLQEIQLSHAKEIESLQASQIKKIQQVQHDADTQIAQFTCVIEELRAKIKELESEHRNKMNVIVLDYEEKLQRSSAQITLLQDQHAGLVARTDANIDAYRRRLDELEEKLKQSQFKQYLAQSSMPSYDTQVERPYSVAGDYDLSSAESCPVIPKPKLHIPGSSQTKTPKCPTTNTLQVTYYGNKPPNSDKTNNINSNKKGPFNITKKRKLYNDKDFQDF